MQTLILQQLAFSQICCYCYTRAVSSFNSTHKYNYNITRSTSSPLVQRRRSDSAGCRTKLQNHGPRLKTLLATEIKHTSRLAGNPLHNKPEHTSFQGPPVNTMLGKGPTHIRVFSMNNIILEPFVPRMLTNSNLEEGKTCSAVSLLECYVVYNNLSTKEVDLVWLSITGGGKGED